MKIRKEYSREGKTFHRFDITGDTVYTIISVLPVGG
jgi:hypothetical protein